MCLIVIAVDAHPGYKLVIAANRDEFYERPTAPAAFWQDAPQLLAGRDLRDGGTWIGVTVTGRIAAVTNYRHPEAIKNGAPSRGKLVAGYLQGEEPPVVFLERLARDGDRYSGFNLLAGDREGLCWYSNYGKEIRNLSPGFHGLSNHLLDTPWPKVEKAKRALEGVLAGEDPSPAHFFSFLSDHTAPPDQHLPDTGVGLEMERMLSPIFIASPGYGTRSSTVILVDREGAIRFTERSYDLQENWSEVSYVIP